MAWFLPSLVAAALAIAVHFSLRRGGGSGVGGGKSASEGVSDGEQGPRHQQLLNDDSPDSDSSATSGPTPYFVIGDLHGDVRCARHWIGKTGLVGNFRPESTSLDDDDPDRWTWNDEVGSALIFVGDYVDKGPTSRQTVELVRALTRRFPDRVTAILGNHELELLRDRSSNVGGESRWGWGGYHQLAYASAHPAEYLNYLDDVTETDELVVELLYNASAEVYGLRHHQYAKIAPPPPPPPARVDGEEAPRSGAEAYYREYGMVPITEYMDPTHRDLVAEKLGAFQRAYLDAYRSDAELGRWVEDRPVMHLAPDGTLFVHGGVSGDVASHLAALAEAEADSGEDESSGGASDFDVQAGVDRLNGLFRSHAHESKLTRFLDGTSTGRAVDELVTYRGNHPHSHYGGDGACSALKAILDVLGGGVKRLAVGHTPDESVRVSCDGKLLAVDSLLGRWIRASGNDYCPGGGGVASSYGEGNAGDGEALRRDPPRSRDGRYVCSEVGETCEGQIVRFDADGEITLIH